MVRRSMAVAVTVGVALMFTACASDPAPTDTPTATAGFATEEEAFAAAEETYREYVDAINSADFADPATFEPIYSLVSGGMLDAAKETFSGYHADGLTMSGEASVTLVEIASWDPESGQIVLATCSDVSDVDLTDPEGTSVVSPDRSDVQGLTVELLPTGEAAPPFTISSIAGREGPPECE